MVYFVIASILIVAAILSCRSLYRAADFADRYMHGED